MHDLNLPVGRFTSRNPVTAGEGMHIDELQQLMDGHGIRHLPILRDGTVVGIVSDRDLRVVAGLSTAQRMQVRAGDIMARDPVAAGTGTPLHEVAATMTERRIGSVLVDDTDGKLVGIFTVTDAMNALVGIIRAMPRPEARAKQAQAVGSRSTAPGRAVACAASSSRSSSSTGTGR